MVNVTAPLVGAVHAYQMDLPVVPQTLTGSGVGSPASRVALAVVPVILPPSPLMVPALANMSLAGAALIDTVASGSTLCTDGSALSRAMSAGSRTAVNPSMAVEYTPVTSLPRRSSPAAFAGALLPGSSSTICGRPVAVGASAATAADAMAPAPSSATEPARTIRAVRRGMRKAGCMPMRW